MGGIVKGLFGGGAPAPAPVVIPPQPKATEMPDPEAEKRAVLREAAQRRRLALSGREDTDLKGKETLG